jgi:hypothetical protein
MRMLVAARDLLSLSNELTQRFQVILAQFCGDLQTPAANLSRSRR